MDFSDSWPGELKGLFRYLGGLQNVIRVTRQMKYVSICGKDSVVGINQKVDIIVFNSFHGQDLHYLWTLTMLLWGRFTRETVWA